MMFKHDFTLIASLILLPFKLQALTVLAEVIFRNLKHIA
jgi:hypothetical protein